MEHATATAVLLIGRPGSGKGTQTKMLAQTLGWKRLSSGDRFKEIRDGAGPLAERVRAVYDIGKFMPDWFADYLVEDVLLNMDSNQGIVIEGFGRTENQAHHLLELFSWLGRDFKVMHLAVSEDEALRRQLERGKKEDRPDSDVEAKIRARFAEFSEKTIPALTLFKEQNVLVEINGEQTPEKVASDIKEALSI